MKETDMLNAWLWENHREDLQWRRVRLGIFPTKGMNRMYMVIMRWADAIVVSNSTVTIVEAKLRPGPGVISQLELYKKLFVQTPEFKAYENYTIKMLILSSVPDLYMIELASEKEIDYEIFTEEQVAATRKSILQPPLE